jgi:hypothetical protein
MAGLWTTARVAEEVGFSEEWVREHAAELGGIRSGASTRSQLRFNPRKIREWEERSQLPAPAPPRIPQRPGPRPGLAGAKLLSLPTRG